MLSALAAGVRDAGWLLLLVSGLGGVYAVVAAELTARHLRRRDPEPAAWPAVSLLKPLHGAHEGLREDLESFCDQDYGAPVQIVFGVHHAHDPAVGVVEALRRARPDLDLALVVGTRSHGANRKISNLINMAPHARHSVWVLSDSDIRVPPDYLRRLAAALSRPGVGAATCLYVGRPGRGLWSALSALGVDQHFLPNVALGTALGLAEPCFGSTVTLRRETLQAAGGLEAFADTLADDYALGAAIRRQGLSVAVPPFVVGHAAQEATARALFLHELRWSRTVQQIDRAGFAGLIVTHALPLALIGAAMTGAGTGAAAGAWAVLAWALAARLYLAERVARATGNRPAPLWMTPLRDILSFIVYLASFGGDSVHWGGERWRTDSRGRLASRAPN